MLFTYSKTKEFHEKAQSNTTNICHLFTILTVHKSAKRKPPSQSEIKRNQSKVRIAFDIQLKTALVDFRAVFN